MFFEILKSITSRSYNANKKCVFKFAGNALYKSFYSSLSDEHPVMFGTMEMELA